MGTECGFGLLRERLVQRSLERLRIHHDDFSGIEIGGWRLRRMSFCVAEIVNSGPNGLAADCPAPDRLSVRRSRPGDGNLATGAEPYAPGKSRQRRLLLELPGRRDARSCCLRHRSCRSRQPPYARRNSNATYATMTIHATQRISSLMLSSSPSRPCPLSPSGRRRCRGRGAWFDTPQAIRSGRGLSHMRLLSARLGPRRSGGMFALSFHMSWHRKSRLRSRVLYGRRVLSGGVADSIVSRADRRDPRRGG